MKIPRVLLSALVFSAVWHLFWISALTVVVAPKDAKPPKFSSVSFLGPILGESILKVSSAAHERSIPEKRYLSEIEKLNLFHPSHHQEVQKIMAMIKVKMQYLS